MTETAFVIGITPRELDELEYHEYCDCVRAYNRRIDAENKRAAAAAHMTARFINAALCGKLRSLENYIGDGEAKRAPKISDDEFDRKLEEARRNAHGADKDA